MSRIRGRTLTGVKSYLSAAHRCRDNGTIHGHTWEIIVWFNNQPRRDARILKQQIEDVLSQWDHGILPDELAWAEDICLYISMIEDVVAVEISRPHEGLLARWESR